MTSNIVLHNLKKPEKPKEHEGFALPTGLFQTKSVDKVLNLSKVPVADQQQLVCQVCKDILNDPLSCK